MRDVTVQATNWLADGRAPRLMRHALTALSCSTKFDPVATTCMLWLLILTDRLSVSEKEN